MARLMERILGHQEVKEHLMDLVRKDQFFNGVIFAGPEGVGKRQIALAMLQELLCESDPACGKCQSCLRVAQEEAIEFLNYLEPQSGKIKVDEIRKTLQFLALQSWAKHRFVLIDQIETITTQAANTILKSLEEPPTGVHFVFITSAPSQILPTIRSRCQVIQFGALKNEELKQLCPELEEWQVYWSMGRLSLARKIMTEEWSTLRKVALNYLHAPSNTQVSQQLQSALADKQKVDFILHCWFSYIRDAVLSSQGANSDFYNGDIVQFVQEFAKKTNLIELYDRMNKMRQDIFGNVDKGLILENFTYELLRSEDASYT